MVCRVWRLPINTPQQLLSFVIARHYSLYIFFHALIFSQAHNLNKQLDRIFYNGAYEIINRTIYYISDISLRNYLAAKLLQ